MLYSKTDYFNYVPGDLGRNKLQYWKKGGIMIYLQGPLPPELKTAANKGNAYFAKKHLLTIKAPTGSKTIEQLRDEKGGRVAGKREDFDKFKLKSEKDTDQNDRYGQNEKIVPGGVTFIFIQEVPPATLEDAFFNALTGMERTKTSFSPPVVVSFGANNIVHRITTAGIVKATKNWVKINVSCDGKGNFCVEHCT